MRSVEVVQTLDYYPYGAERIASGSFNEQRGFIGEEFDEETDLSYLNARYYDGARGQFNSQDPMFWRLPAQLLVDPQQQNSYSYARNNPIVYKDPTGELAFIPVLGYVYLSYAAADFSVDLYHAKTVFIDYPQHFTIEEKIDAGADVVLDVAGGAITRYGFVGAKAAAPLLFDTFTAGQDVVTTLGSKIINNHKNKNNKSNSSLSVSPSSNSQNIPLPQPTPYLSQSNQTPSSNSPSSQGQNTTSSRSNASNTAMNSAYNSLSAASQAISRGDYAAANKHLNNASKSLNKVK